MVAITLLLSALVATGLAAPATDSSKTLIERESQNNDYVWRITRLSLRKPDGKHISNISFHIQATNGGSLNFECSAHDSEGRTPGKIDDGKSYYCGDRSSIRFAWQDGRAGLLIRQHVSDKIKYVGTTSVPNYCRAGGNGRNDFICSQTEDAYVTLVQER